MDARDIADVAVAALGAPEDHRGRAHTITGPEAVPVASVARELSARLGHRIRAEDPPPHETLHGLDPWTAGILGDLYHRVRHGGFAELSSSREADNRPGAHLDGGAFIDAHLDEWRTSE
ncbi:hypothetical protein ACFSTC_27150 [Nonomuraea ferruginea]